MKTILYKANTRGHANHGWLDTYYSFSFADYYNPERMNFGVLRVLNDDTIDGGRGFSFHPHDNMEIISIPLEGDLEHKDSMGNVAVIKEGDLQVMSAGTGVMHSEYNKNKDKAGKFLQIWILPNKRNVEPRYDQISIRDFEKQNEFYQLVSPNKNDQGVWIHQNAWFFMGNFDENFSAPYALRNEQNGVFVFVIDGQVEINDQVLSKRDGFGIWESPYFLVKTLSKAKILIMEVPMSF
jgi:redox-sensitive bicupin YhaK (pirin superfamily)